MAHVMATPRISINTWMLVPALAGSTPSWGREEGGGQWRSAMSNEQ